MKKVVSLVLTVGICLSATVIFTACRNNEPDAEPDTTAAPHEHSYQTEWAYDITHHWHECVGENCTGVSEKAEHAWNEGEITAEATAEAEGVKTVTCTVCHATKNEAVAFSGIGKAEWEALVNPDFYKNFTVTTTQIDMYYKSVSEIKVVDRHAYIFGTIYNLETNEPEGTQSGDMELTDAYYSTLLPVLKNYDKIEYDSENNVYRYTETYEANIKPDTIATYTKMEWILKDGKVWKTQSEFWYIDKVDGRVDVTITQEYTDYGTTVAPIA